MAIIFAIVTIAEAIIKVSPLPGISTIIIASGIAGPPYQIPAITITIIIGVAGATQVLSGIASVLINAWDRHRYPYGPLELRFSRDRS